MTTPTFPVQFMAAAAIALFAGFHSPQADLSEVPDLTGGGEIPGRADHDWALGATGARGWMHCEKLVTSGARQVAVTEVAVGSPAEGVLAVGDVILGVSGEAFGGDPRVELGRALTQAESEEGRGSCRCFGGGQMRWSGWLLSLKCSGTMARRRLVTARSRSGLSRRGALRMAEPGYGPNPIPRSLNALALLASVVEEYLPLVRRGALWETIFSAKSSQTWYHGYTCILLAEHFMATGGEEVIPGLWRLASAAANGQSAVSSWGHRFAKEDGRLAGSGVAPYMFLGPATYVRHEGSRPIAFEWKLESPIPADALPGLSL